VPLDARPLQLATLASGERVDDMAIESGTLVFGGGVEARTEGGNVSFNGFLSAVAVSGGTVRSLWNGAEEVSSLSVRPDGRIAFATYDFPSRSGALQATDLGSGRTESIAAWNSTAGCAGVVATADAIFWTRQMGGTGHVSRSSWDSPGADELAQGYACPGRARVAGTSLVWLSGRGIESLLLPSAGPAPAPRALGPPADLFPSEATALAVQSGSTVVYVAAGSAVYRITLDGSVSPAFDGGAPVVALSAASGSVFAATSGGLLVRWRPDGEISSLASGLDSATALVADDQAVYWAEKGTIAKVRY
jgi:hypothetical protein